ncbi:MAG: DASS family sodium-coupled anion symporter [Planctomycetota bacterium]
MTESPKASMEPLPSRARWIGLVLGPLVAGLLIALLPAEYVDLEGARVPFDGGARATLAIMAWMAVWWLTEAVDLEATALLPVALFPLVGAGTVAETTAPYASQLIFLFMGGFLIALSMQRWGLDRRIALLTLSACGTTPTRLVGGFMVATAAMSTSISNTATTAMMLPIGLGVIGLVREQGGAAAADERRWANFPLCLLLSIAYAASIGGMSTIIGSPPNGFLVQFAQDELGVEISFLRWVAIGGPVALVFLPIAWWAMTRVLYPVPREPIAGGPELLRRELDRLGPMSRGEAITLGVFALTVVAWATRPLLRGWAPGLSDGSIAITGALLLFVLPVSARRGIFAMDWRTGRDLPFGILLLFGGGLSLAAAVKRNGVAEFFAAQAGALEGFHPFALLLALTAGMIFLTELTSNLATTATLVPVLSALGPALGLSPLLLVVPVTIAASCAFMLPIATPPNAIVFGSGQITIRQMCRAGLWLNLVGIALISVLMYFLVLPRALP